MSHRTPRGHRGLLWAAAATASIAALAMSTVTAQAATAGGTQPSSKPPPPNQRSIINDPVPAGFSSWKEVMDVQAGLHSAAMEISRAADAAGGDRLGSISANPDDRAVTLYWKGPMPAPVASLIGQLRHRVAIRVLPARYGQRELIREAKRLSHLPQAARQIAELGPMNDASGLRVALRRTSTTGPAAAATAPLVAPVTSPIRLVLERGGAPSLAYDRYHDTSPFWGGGAFYTEASSLTANVCTVGWAVSDNATGAHKLLTAGHCAKNGVLATTGDPDNSNDLFVGKTERRITGEDVELINPGAVTIGASSAGRVYNGGFFSAMDPYTSSFSLPVGGADHSILGEDIFTSGALSGFRGAIKVSFVNQTVPFLIDGVSTPVFPLNIGTRADGGNVAGNGDSGGPVATFLNGDFSHVTALGTITGSDTLATCTGVPASATRTCGSRVFYVPIMASMPALGVSILTGT